MGSTISYYIYGATDASGNVLVEDASGNSVEDISGNVVRHGVSEHCVKDVSGCVITGDASGNCVKDVSGCIITRDASGNVVIREEPCTDASNPISVPIPIRFTPTIASQLVPPASTSTTLSVSPLNSQNIHIVRRHKGRKTH